MDRQDFEDKLTALLLGDDIPGYVLVLVDDDNGVVAVSSNILGNDNVEDDHQAAVTDVLEAAIEAVNNPTDHNTVKQQ